MKGDACLSCLEVSCDLGPLRLEPQAGQYGIVPRQPEEKDKFSP